MAALDWELVRDLGLVKAGLPALGILSTAEDIEREIQARQGLCLHVPNPERPERCYKCGAPPVERPGLAKTRKGPLEIRRVG